MVGARYLLRKTMSGVFRLVVVTSPFGDDCDIVCDAASRLRASLPPPPKTFCREMDSHSQARVEASCIREISRLYVLILTCI